ncbi:MAG: ATP-binding protein [Patescibacteria group bacterium]
MIERAIASKLLALAGKFPVVALIGPRQSGKTTLVRNLFAKKAYVSLEDPDRREFAATDPRGFLRSLPGGAVIDEAQRVPGLFSYMQTLIDERGSPGFFILTGSQNFLLQESLSQSLAGRVALLRLLPFSLTELEAAGYALDEPETYLFKGFYPRIYDREIAPSDWYPNYVQTYVERDVRLLKNITDLDAFQRFLRLCAGRIGQVLNLSSLGDDCGISHNTARAWLSVLEASYIVFLLRPHHKNFSKRLIKSPKIYFLDPGLACSLLGLGNQEQLSSHYLRSGLFESMMIAEIVKARFNLGLESNCWFWRDQSGHEVDCLLEEAGALVPIEFKAGKTASPGFFHAMQYWCNLAGVPAARAYVIYGGDDNLALDQGNLVSWRKVASISAFGRSAPGAD